jgi:hypothetical protein
MDQDRQTTIYDADGNPILIIGERSSTIMAPDKSISRLEYSDSILLVDGLSWTPAMASGANPVYLTSCQRCREPPIWLPGRRRGTHGLLSVRNARVCASCGAVTCPRHRRFVLGAWRCHDCVPWVLLRRILKLVFFSLHRES